MKFPKVHSETIIGVITIVGCLFLVERNPDLVSSLIPLIIIVLTYFFGSSPGSRMKDKGMIKSLKNGNGEGEKK